MFIQVIQAKARDRDALKRQFDKWTENLQPEATGYIGSTGGVTDDGEAFFAARFESEEAARKSSDRPEQGSWWEETSKYLEAPTFTDYTNVELSLGGGSDNAGFVQVMQGKTNDLERVRELGQEFDAIAKEVRPDLIGAVNCWKEDGSFTTINYFTSEEEARRAESQDMPEDAAAQFKEWDSLISVDKWIDLKDPWLRSG